LDTSFYVLNAYGTNNWTVNAEGN